MIPHNSSSQNFNLTIDFVKNQAFHSYLDKGIMTFIFIEYLNKGS